MSNHYLDMNNIYVNFNILKVLVSHIPNEIINHRSYIKLKVTNYSEIKIILCSNIMLTNFFNTIFNSILLYAISCEFIFIIQILKSNQDTIYILNFVSPFIFFLSKLKFKTYNR